MTNEQNHIQEVMKTIEKPWYKSKKYLAFLLTLLGLLGLASAVVTVMAKVGEFSWAGASALIVIVVCATFASIAFNLNQAKTDSFVRVAAVLSGKLPKSMAKELKMDGADDDS